MIQGLGQFRVPDEDDVVGFFGADPIERDAQDGYWCYDTHDERGVNLRFSYSLYERSVQTVLSFAGLPISSVTHEGAERMALRDGTLVCEFATEGSTTTLTIEAGRNISVRWSTLRTR